jgi:hypothetical protein
MLEFWKRHYQLLAKGGTSVANRMLPTKVEPNAKTMYDRLREKRLELEGKRDAREAERKRAEAKPKQTRIFLKRVEKEEE